MPETPDGELKFKDSVSQSCRELIKWILNPNVQERPSAKEILKHSWFKETPDVLDIFDEQEKNLIRQEFTIKVNPESNNYQLNTDFTEQSICSLGS